MVDVRREGERIIYEKDGPIARIILNWPEKANAQDSTMVWEVDDALLDADRDYDVKVLIVKANGNGFCAGHVIRGAGDPYPEFTEASERTGTAWKGQYDIFVRPVFNLWEFSKPTISQIHGYCLGGGTHYGLVTDMVIASDDSYYQYSPLQGFGMPSGECSIEPWVFMNWRRAGYYLFTGQTLDAAQALDMGLVNEVVPRAELETRVEQVARIVAQAPLSTLMMTKANLKRAWEMMGMRVHWQMSNDLAALASKTSDVQAHIGRVMQQGTRPRQLAEQLRREAEQG